MTDHTSATTAASIEQPAWIRELVATLGQKLARVGEVSGEATIEVLP